MLTTIKVILAMQGVLYDDYQGDRTTEVVVVGVVLLFGCAWAMAKLEGWRYGRKHRYVCRQCGKEDRPDQSYFHDAMNDALCVACWAKKRELLFADKDV